MLPYHAIKPIIAQGTNAPDTVFLVWHIRNGPQLNMILRNNLIISRFYACKKLPVFVRVKKTKMKLVKSLNDRFIAKNNS